MSIKPLQLQNSMYDILSIPIIWKKFILEFLRVKIFIFQPFQLVSDIMCFTVI